MINNAIISLVGVVVVLKFCVILYDIVHPVKNICALDGQISMINRPTQKPQVNSIKTANKPIIRNIVELNRSELSKKINEKHGPNVKRK